MNCIYTDMTEVIFKAIVEIDPQKPDRILKMILSGFKVKIVGPNNIIGISIL